tara:strand:- start:360 stop:962 length:603 start_codon:yes stop_codon:yes gene_type:complete
MKKFSKILLIAIFVTLIAGSVQSVAADHLEPGTGIFLDKGLAISDYLKDSKYQVYLQIVLRTEDGQLISVIESSIVGTYLPHNLTDHIFNTLMGKKEIITIDNIKYEKVQYIYSPTHDQSLFGLQPIFYETPLNYLPSSDAHTKMHEKHRETSIWKNFYCGEFKGHGSDCITIFQVTSPNLSLEPHDAVTQHWIILRELN